MLNKAAEKYLQFEKRALRL